MKANTKSVVNVAGAGALALVMATSVLAAPPRGNDRRTDSTPERHESQSRGTYRDNQRVDTSGRIRSLTRENGGYRVQLDRGSESYWVPAARVRNRANDFRVGVSIVFGGVYRGGRIDVDAVSWPDDRGSREYRDQYVRGVVERIDYRSGMLLLRDARSGRTIDVNMRDTVRSSRIDLADLRRGDSVELSGDWLRGGDFAASRIESVDSGRR